MTKNSLLFATAAAAFFTGYSIGLYSQFQNQKEKINKKLTKEYDLKKNITLNNNNNKEKNNCKITEYIDVHPFVKNLKNSSSYKEIYTHSAIPENLSKQIITASTLLGNDLISIPPLTFIDNKDSSLISIYHLGKNLCGHPGIVHGGILATLIDENLARCAFISLPNKIGVTASLSLHYKSPAFADSYVVFKAHTIKIDGRKCWVKGYLETLPTNSLDVPTILVEAEALIIEPKWANKLPKLHDFNEYENSAALPSTVPPIASTA